VFNETGSRGYICLYFTGSHFDVMCGVDGGRPPVPASAERHDCMSWHPVQLDKVYAFPGVCSWPANESVNVVVDGSPSYAQSRLYTYADVVRSGSPETTHTEDKQHTRPSCAQHKPQRQMTENSCAEHEQEESHAVVHKCTVCSHEFNSVRGLRTHCVNAHRVQPCITKTAV